MLTQQVWSRPLWEVMLGGATQQRVWTFGNSRMTGDVGAHGREVHTSQRPLPLIEGAAVTSVAAGRWPGAATAAGSFEVLTWGGISAAAMQAPVPAEVTLQPVASPLASASPLPPSLPPFAWRPANCEPVLELAVQEVELLPKQMSLKALLQKLPPSLRQGLRDTDPEGEKEEKVRGLHAFHVVLFGGMAVDETETCYNIALIRLLLALLGPIQVQRRRDQTVACAPPVPRAVCGVRGSPYACRHGGRRRLRMGRQRQRAGGRGRKSQPRGPLSQ